LHKKHILLPIIGFVSIGLAACQNDESAVQDRTTNRVQPFGYYSNENHQNGGNVRILNDNDGPITEIMDHTFGDEGMVERNQKRQILETRDENGNPGNPTKPYSTYDRNFFERDNRFSTGDMNYHGHLDGRQARILAANDTDSAVHLANRLTTVVRSVANVQDVHTYVYKNNVIIALDLENVQNAEQTRQQVQRAVQPYLNGRTLNIVSDEGTFTRIRDINRNQGMRDGLDMNFRNDNRANISR
jgi:spore cortex protein